ncbi:uncharacterized protein Z519_10509 [Cladophialophora bantiana CBS 173.52]|uniref:SP-RING-type domain-containing protein n=1 Tax=Cladophialophora bantiana (strain ATCC 10958 / CBS 173.52 / CDC B-1940 / NIH 8579) TaxID=1442370 RepID=A0A0D2HWV7_CLAB1|nr:uncharacterized protein Z519_10509 [Cladophialophora bantiana CBS 173.52]KIW89024.1 hypothetical protein Z519_10509 [Cladophialophora bantiana CBS 173.52]
MQKALFYHLHHEGANNPGRFNQALRLFEQEIEDLDSSSTSNISEAARKWGSKYSQVCEANFAALQMPAGGDHGGCRPAPQAASTHMPNQTYRTPSHHLDSAPSNPGPSPMLHRGTVQPVTAVGIQEIASAWQARQTVQSQQPLASAQLPQPRSKLQSASQAPQCSSLNSSTTSMSAAVQQPDSAAQPSQLAPRTTASQCTPVQIASAASHSQLSTPSDPPSAAHIHSPEYRRIDEFNGNASNTPCYEFVEALIVAQECIHADSALVYWNVHISQDHWARRAASLPAAGQFGPRERDVSNDNVQFRLRSIAVQADGGGKVTPTPSDFHVQPTKWPIGLAVSINGDYGVEFKRSKAPNGAHLATDVTDLLKEGDNEVVVGAYFTPQEERSRCVYLMAVEVICVANHDKIANYDKMKSMPTRIPKADVIGAITESLKSKRDRTEVVDLTISQSAINIDLMDPLTSVIWTTPVRGRECRHQECFDLEAFLFRRTDGVNKGSLASPDRWKCPICEGYAPPNMLVIDEFLLEVRKTLEKDRQWQAQAIDVKEDGTWEPKFPPTNPRNQARDMSATERSIGSLQSALRAVTQAPTASRAIGTDSRSIIVIDDD